MAGEITEDEEAHALLMELHDRLVGLSLRTRYAETTVTAARHALWSLAAALLMKIDERNDDMDKIRRQRRDGA